MTINLDFDGTVVKHFYPKIGSEIGATPVLKKLAAKGHQLILFTMRSGKTLDEAVMWFEERDIPLYGIQSNPTQSSWTTSPKSYAELMIDDSALGCPLTQDSTYLENMPIPIGRPYVDWVKVEKILTEKGIL